MNWSLIKSGLPALERSSENGKEKPRPGSAEVLAGGGEGSRKIA